MQFGCGDTNIPEINSSSSPESQPQDPGSETAKDETGCDGWWLTCDLKSHLLSSHTLKQSSTNCQTTRGTYSDKVEYVLVGGGRSLNRDK